MIWANVDGRRVNAWPGGRAQCPSCGGEVIAKCGKIVEWHWAHVSRECDSWAKPESQWHISWKSRFPAEWQEVKIGEHRADVLTPRGVIEFQRSSISADEIQERERFYGNMIWVVHASRFTLEPCTGRYVRDHEILNPEPDGPDNLFDLLNSDVKENYDKALASYYASRKAYTHQRLMADPSPSFRWLWPHKTWLQATKKVFLDIPGNGTTLLRLDKTYGYKYTYIATTKLSLKDFMRACRNPITS